MREEKEDRVQRAQTPWTRSDRLFPLFLPFKCPSIEFIFMSISHFRAVP